MLKFDDKIDKFRVILKKLKKFFEIIGPIFSCLDFISALVHKCKMELLNRFVVESLE